MKPFNIYVLDFFVCLMYIVFSYFFCLIIFFHYIEILFLFEVYPLLFLLSTKRFILTQVTHLFNAIWFFSLTMSTILVYPLFVHQFKQFLSSGWYKYQIKLYNNLTNKSSFLFVIIYLSIHFFLIPNILNFFLYWEVSDEYSLLRIEAEISLYFYILWLTAFKFTFSVMLIILIKTFTFTFYVTSTNFTYFYLLRFKKIFIFIVISFLFLLTPSEFITQILTIFCVYLFVEFLFFYICIKYLIKNAYLKTIIKKAT